MKLILTSIIISLFTVYLQAQNSIDLYLKLDSLQKLETTEESLPPLELLSAANPYNAYFHYYLGEAYHSTGKYRESTDALLKAQDLGVFYRSNYYLACNYVHLEKPDSAILFLRRHLSTALNGENPYGNLLEDSIFISLRKMPGFKALQAEKQKDEPGRNEKWITDFEYLSYWFKEIHYDPFFKLEEKEWDKAMQELINKIPSSNNDQMIVSIRQFLAKVGDGHCRIFSIPPGFDQSKELPVSTSLFSDGCYIVAATEEYKELLGAKIINVCDIAFDSVFSAVSTTIPIDNEMGFRAQFSWHFRNMNLLHGLGIAESNKEITFRVSLDGKTFSKKLRSVDNNDPHDFINYHDQYQTNYPIFLENYRKGSLKWYWFNYLEESRIMYVQLNGIMTSEDDPLPRFCDSIKSILDTTEIAAFVLDIRNNGGGNTELNKHILSLLLSDEVNIKGKLFTVIGPRTFSAAQNLTTVIENYTETIFIGEPTGSRPNFIGEVYPITLPYSQVKVSASNVYHQHGNSADQRTWIPPDILVKFSFEDYKNGNDPVLQEITDYVENR